MFTSNAASTDLDFSQVKALVPVVEVFLHSTAAAALATCSP